MQLEQYIRATDKRLESFKGDKRLFWAGQMADLIHKIEHDCISTLAENNTFGMVGYAKDKYNLILFAEVRDD